MSAKKDSEGGKDSTLVTLERKGEAKTITLPKKFSQLVKAATQHFSVEDPVFLDLECNQLDESSYANLLKTQQKIFVFGKDEEKTLSDTQEVVVDITPSKNILLKSGTAEYSVAAAIAEFVDNSIQAVRGNAPENRIIQLRISPEKRELIVWDNGRGMTKEELRKWATMGISQGDEAGNQGIDDDSGKGLTGLISRFGVGAKRAAFYLGTEITVKTKVASSSWVNETTLSAERLNEYGDQNWKISIKVRNPVEKELRHAQFTNVRISNLHFPFPHLDEAEQVDGLMRELSHIYHYYTRESDETVREDTEPTDKEPDSSQKSSESDKATKKRKKKQGVLYGIRFNGKYLEDVEDMETKYVTNGKCFKKMDLKMTLPNDKQTIVKCHLRYFPFLDGVETLPVSFKEASMLTHPDSAGSAKPKAGGKENKSKGKGEKAKAKDAKAKGGDSSGGSGGGGGGGVGGGGGGEREGEVDALPLQMRRHGFDVYWNGRLIPEAHFERLAFMALGTIDGVKIEEKWLQRVKGNIFLDANFPVTHNKMHICKEDPTIQMLETHSTRKEKEEFKKWIVKCHKLDQEVQYLGGKYDATENKTRCTSFVMGGEEFQIGDHIALKRGSGYAKISDIFYKGHPDSKLSEGYCSLEVAHYKTLPKQEYPISKIKQKVEDKVVEEYLKNLSSRIPGKLKLFAGDSVDLPESEYVAGSKIKAISVGVYDRQKSAKLCEKKILDDEGVSVRLTVTHNETNTQVYECDAAVYYKTARICFTDMKCFNKVGTYTLLFEANFDGVAPVKHVITVRAGRPASVSTAWVNQSSVSKCPLGAPLPPIRITQYDAQENPLAFSKADIKQLSFHCLAPASDTKIEVPTPNDVVLETNGTIVIRDIVVPTADLGDESEATLSLVTTLKLSEEEGESQAQSSFVLPESLTSVLEEISFVAGEAVELFFVEDPFDNGITNFDPISEFMVIAKDQSGNVVKFAPKVDDSSSQTNTNANGKKRKLMQKRYAKSKRRSSEGPAAPPEDDALPGYVLEVASEVFDKVLKVEMDSSGMFNVGGAEPLVVQQTSAFDREAFDVNFSLLRDGSQVLTATKKLKVLPSSRPVALKVVPAISIGEDGEMEIDTSQQAKFCLEFGVECSWKLVVLSAGGGTEASLPLRGFSGTLTTSWHTEEIQITDSSDLIDLPPFSVEQATDKTVTLTVQFVITNLTPSGLASSANGSGMSKLGDDQTTTLETSFEVEVLSGPPSSLDWEDPPKKKIQCGDTVNLGVVIKDAQGGLVSVLPQDLVEHYEEKKLIIDYTSEQSVELRECECVFAESRWTVKATFFGVGTVCLTASDPSEKLASARLYLDVTAKKAYCLRVNKKEEYAVQAASGDYLEEIFVTSCDVYGNLVPLAGNRIEATCVRSMPLQLPEKMTLQNGLANLKNLIAEAPPGTYEIKFECKNVSLKTASLILTITSGPSMSPVSVPSTCVAGSTLPVSVIQMVKHNGEKIKVEEKRVTLELNKTTYSCILDPSDSTYHFSNVPCPTKAGSYDMKFQCKNVKTNFEFTAPLTVTAGPPVKLEVIDPNFEIISCDGSNEGLILKETKLQLEDAFGNQVATDGGVVKISIEPVDDVQLSGKDLPKVRGATQQKMVDGVATFEKICLAEGVGKSGMYNICFSLVGVKEVAPKVLEFFYQNELDFLEHKVNLQKQKMQINSRIKSKNAELATLRDELEGLDNEKKAHETDFNQKQDRLFALIPTLKKEDLRSRKSLLNMLANYEAELQKTHSGTPRAPKSRNAAAVPDLENDPTVIGRINQIVCVDDEIEARLLAKHCGRRLEGIVVQNQEAFDKYHKILENSKTGIYLMSVESMLSWNKVSSGGHLDIPVEPDAPTEGFLGHASNRVQLREEHEHLRKTLVWNLFQNLMVFDTLKHGFAYRNHLVKKGKSCPTIIGLQDENFIEASGMVLVGEKKMQTQAGDPSFGQLPHSDNPNLKRLQDTKSGLEEFIESATKRKQFLSEYSNTDDLRHRVSEIENEVSSLSADLRTVNEGLKSLDVAHPPKSSGSASSSAADVSLDSQPPTSSPSNLSSQPPSPPPTRQNGKGKSSKKRKFVDQD